jgi:predicted extracellular nuclease
MRKPVAAWFARAIQFQCGGKSKWKAVVALAGMLVASGAASAAGAVVVSQVYGGGGNAGATFTNDFIELHNNSETPVSVDGWSVQYASATGTGNFQATPIAGTIPPGGYYLIQESKGAGGTQSLPTPDALANINMSATAGKVIVARSPTALSCNGGSAPCSPTQLALIVDLVGYGGADFFEAAPTPSLTNTTAAIRAGGGCTDTDNNSADFTTGAPTPRNSASPVLTCSGPINQPVVANCPASLQEVVDGSGAVASAQVTASDADGLVSTAVISSAAVSGISLVIVQTGSPLIAQLSVQPTTAVGNYAVTLTFMNSDPTPQSATCTVNVSVTAPATQARIHDIQGRAHISPLNGQAVAQVPGIVTSLRTNGFTMQDPNPDSDPATSEAIFVFTSSAPTVHVGDSVLVDGTVAEFRPGGDPTNLTSTEIDRPVITLSSSGNPLPPPVILGAGGRAIPAGAFANATTGNVETSSSFDPLNDAIDFYESLEDMRVQINNAVAVGPTNSFGEIPVLADQGAAAVLRSAHGGTMAGPGNFNPERMILAGTLVSTPQVNVGDQFNPITAIVDYSFGDYKFDITTAVTVTSSSLQQEVTPLVGTPSQLTIASFNVENLAPTDPASKFQALGAQVTNNLHSPDILALMEIQDNDGSKNDGVVDATTTFNDLIAAIQAAGGPVYQFRSINPLDGQDGGQPGGNIRVGFLFNPLRVSFVDRPGGGPTVQTTVVSGQTGPQLSASPGRIQDFNGAFDHSRKPLAAEFMFNGRHLFVIANHFNAKDGDDPLFGPHQPPLTPSDPQRHQQAQVVNAFVSTILALDKNAAVVVLGDLNDFEFSQTLDILKTNGALADTVLSLPPDERYTFDFEGNSEVLDHILLSPALNGFAGAELDIVHTNSEFSGQVSDHEPDVIRLRLPLPGDVDGDGDVDQADVSAIVAARNTRASGPFDPRDLNNDSVIDINDARLATLACTRARCAQQ